MNNAFLYKYNLSIINDLDIQNMKKIIAFLEQEGWTFIDELLTDYLDIFTIDFNSFVRKYRELNKKYSNSYLEMVKIDMNYLEELLK